MDKQEKENNNMIKLDKYIPKRYFKAVLFAAKMIDKDMPFMFAVKKASFHYQVDESIIIDYLPEDTKREYRREYEKQ